MQNRLYSVFLKSLKSLSIEAIGTCLGVFLGLYLENKAEIAKNEKVVVKSLNSIEQEISSNIDTLKVYIARQQKLQISLKNLLNGSQIISDAQLAFPLPDLNTSAWNSVVASNTLSFMDHKILRALSDAYTQQNEIEIIKEKIIQAHIIPSHYSSTNIWYRHKSYMLTVILKSERNAIKAHESAIKVIKSPHH